jgi:hypothetical protein
MWRMQRLYAKLSNEAESKKQKPSPTTKHANLHVTTCMLLAAFQLSVVSFQVMIISIYYSYSSR